MSRGDPHTFKETHVFRTVLLAQRYAYLSQASKREVAKVMDAFGTLSAVSHEPYGAGSFL